MTLLRTSALVAGLIVVAGAHGQGNVATVNGVAIPQQRMDFFLRTLAAQGRPDSPELRALVKEELVNRELMTQEAVRRGLHKRPDVTSQLELTRQDVLSRAFMQEVAKGATVSEDAMKKEYERIKGQLGTKEYKPRHILVKSEDEAKEIIAQIKKGASFEKIAAEKSQDTGNKSRGGELDWSVPGSYVKPFGDALVKLKKGQLTDAPVQSNFGWHVIRLDDERGLKVPSYEEVKPNLQQQLQRQAGEKILTDLRAKAKIE